jgi:hypothetical protein
MIMKRNNKGYTLLFAVLTAVLVVGVAAFITSVSRKQFLLASTARESIYSIYAADRALECAIFTFADVTVNTGAGQSMDCNADQHVTFTFPTTPTGGAYVSNAQAIQFTDTNQCAILTITLTTKVDNGQTYNVRVFDARGYNVPCVPDGPNWKAKPTALTLERALKVTFKGGKDITP